MRRDGRVTAYASLRHATLCNVLSLGTPWLQFFPSPVLYFFLTSSPRRKMFVLLLLSSFSSLVSASVHCSTLIPPHAVPSLESCDAALQALERTNAQCGPDKVVFSPTATGARVVRLPAVYIGSEQAPTTDLICVISILWQPKPGARRSLTSVDLFPFGNILDAAYNIRNWCIRSSAHYYPRLGRAWIGPHNWVDVQFGSVLGPRGLAINASDVGGGGLTVRWADGSIQNVTSSMLGQSGGCGAATGFEGEMGANILKVS